MIQQDIFFANKLHEGQSVMRECKGIRKFGVVEVEGDGSFNFDFSKLCESFPS
jgi:hypothetical protein